MAGEGVRELNVFGEVQIELCLLLKQAGHAQASRRMEVGAEIVGSDHEMAGHRTTTPSTPPQPSVVQKHLKRF